MTKFLALALLATGLSAQDTVDGRGDRAMGFSHEKTTHHFLLFKDGGAIEVQADDPRDAASRDRIRDHLRQIAAMFAAGDFELPMFIHDRVPPGVPAMKRLKGQIHYQPEITERGAQVRISTSNPEAIKVIHAFLRFQIRDHRTGDPLQVTVPR